RDLLRQCGRNGGAERARQRGRHMGGKGCVPGTKDGCRRAKDIQQQAAGAAAHPRRLRQPDPVGNGAGGWKAEAGSVGGRVLHGAVYSGERATSPTSTGALTCMISPYETLLNTRKMNRLPYCSSGSLICALQKPSTPL